MLNTVIKSIIFIPLHELLSLKQISTKKLAIQIITKMAFNNPSNQKTSIISIIALLISMFSQTEVKSQNDYDIIIYGATSAGIVAAVESTRMEKSVLIIEPTNRIGGLTTGGLGATDIGNKIAIGGISREFYERIAEKYASPDAWKWQKRERPVKTKWTFEPKVAHEVFEELISEHKIPIVLNERLDLTKGVIKNGGRIQSIIMESGKIFTAKVFIDASYEGDLMALAGISYTVGRESNTAYGETLNGVQTKLAQYHQFPDHVDPYIVKGKPSSGLLPNVNIEPGAEGGSDKKVQAYCFRMCLTNVPENRIPFEKPEKYTEIEYELLFRALEAGYKGPLFIMSKMPNGKTDSNNKGPFSSDYIGRNYNYPDGNYKTREKIIEAHEIYQKGLLWTLANHPRIPKKIREEYSTWGLPKDEFIDYGHWTPQLYIREARRMVSDFVMTEHHCTQDSISANQSVGMGAYTMDSHHTQRYITEEGFVKNEGDVEVGGFSPYPISYKALVPKKSECINLLVPVCLSASHMAFGSIRMEPVFMVLGQSAAVAACLAINDQIPVQEIDYHQLKKILLSKGQVLSLK